MAGIKVFVSSTCYDLNIVRSQLRSFLLTLGYEPIMSEYSDVLFDPRMHTHTSCLQEVAGCDVVVLIIGSRFGGRVVPEAINSVDFDTLRELSFNPNALQHPEKLSITQFEVLKAIQEDVPIFTFVDQRIWHDHQVYEKNKEKGIVKDITFPSIEKPETAAYIFEFLNFLRNRVRGNSVSTFTRMDDIQQHLTKQWASLFQRLLFEQRTMSTERRRIDALTEQLEDLKTAILTSIGRADSGAIARGVVRFRRLIDFVRRLRIDDATAITEFQGSWKELLSKAGVVQVVPMEPKRREAISRSRTALVLKDGTYYESWWSRDILHDLSLEWDAFTIMKSDDRRVIVDALAEMGRIMNPHILMHRDEPFSQPPGVQQEPGLEEYLESKDEDR